MKEGTVLKRAFKIVNCCSVVEGGWGVTYTSQTAVKAQAGRVCHNR
jgi:hypothetical protein